jgi:hypothetical protein
MPVHVNEFQLTGPAPVHMLAVPVENVIWTNMAGSKDAEIAASIALVMLRGIVAFHILFQVSPRPIAALLACAIYDCHTA